MSHIVSPWLRRHSICLYCCRLSGFLQGCEESYFHQAAVKNHSFISVVYSRPAVLALIPPGCSGSGGCVGRPAPCTERRYIWDRRYTTDRRLRSDASRANVVSYGHDQIIDELSDLNAHRGNMVFCSVQQIKYSCICDPFFGKHTQHPLLCFETLNR